MVLEALLGLLSEHVQVEEIQEFGCEAMRYIFEKRIIGDVKCARERMPDGDIHRHHRSRRY